MIKNKTIGYATKEDALYLTKTLYWSRRNLVITAVEVIVGVFLLRFNLPWWIAVLIYRQRFSAEDMLILIFGAGLSLFCIVYPFICPYRLAAKAYRRDVANRAKTSGEVAFEESIVIRAAYKEDCSETHTEYSGKTHVEYSCVEWYLEGENVVYIRIMFNKSPSYIILYDDAYIEGSREELIRFLEERNIKRLKK